MKKRLHWASIVRVTKRLFLNESLLSKLDYISKYVKCLFMTLVSAMNKSVKSQAFIRSRVQNFPLFAPDFFTGQLFSFKIPTCPRFPRTSSLDAANTICRMYYIFRYCILTFIHFSNVCSVQCGMKVCIYVRKLFRLHSQIFLSLVVMVIEVCLQECTYLCISE